MGKESIGDALVFVWTLKSMYTLILVLWSMYFCMYRDNVFFCSVLSCEVAGGIHGYLKYPICFIFASIYADMYSNN